MRWDMAVGEERRDMGVESVVAVEEERKFGNGKVCTRVVEATIY